MDVVLQLVMLKDEADRMRGDAERSNETEWAAAYRGQSFAYSQAIRIVKESIQNKQTPDGLPGKRGE